MIMRNVSTLVLGTGPAGLTAGYRLAQAGQRPVLVERGNRVGGLMQSIHRGGAILDIGRKQMYSRIPEIDELWTGLLGDDYIPYERRVGILYKGHILESSRRYKGATLGMPPSLLLSCGADFFWSWMTRGMTTPSNEEEYWYRRRGKKLSQVLTQNFEERFRGDRWRDQPVPEHDGKGFVGALLSKFRTAVRDTPEGPAWRHPAEGTGQIVSALEKGIVDNGGEFHLGTNVERIVTDGDRVVSVLATRGEEKIEYRPEHVIGALPVELLAKLVLPETERRRPAAQGKGRSTALVYLSFDSPPPFPHTFIEVTCPDTKIGRIANFAAMGGRMIPEGKSVLCVEYFLDSDDPLMEKTAEEIGQYAIQECVQANLFSAEDVKECFPLKFPGADAATDYRDWLTDERREILGRLEAFPNLFFVNRAGADVASYAGAEAARAIVSGDRSLFDRRTDPRYSEDDPDERAHADAEANQRADSAA